MAEVLDEHAELAKADADIAAGERRVAEQIELIEWLAKHHHDTAMAEQLLRVFEQTLDAWREHRQLILGAIARQEGPQP